MFDEVYSERKVSGDYYEIRIGAMLCKLKTKSFAFRSFMKKHSLGKFIVRVEPFPSNIVTNKSFDPSTTFEWLVDWFIQNDNRFTDINFWKIDQSSVMSVTHLGFLRDGKINPRHN